MTAKSVSIALALSFLLVYSAAALNVSNLAPDHYTVGSIAVDEKYYVDRDYTVIALPGELDGAILIMTGNGEKNGTGAGFITFDIDQAATVYIGHDSRGEEAKGGVPPAWLSDDFTVVEGWEIEVTDGNMGTFNVWKKDFSAGAVSLPGNADAPAAGHGSMYTVLLTPALGAAVEPGAKLTTTWGDLKSE